MNNATLNQLLLAPVMPDTESFYFPHNESIKQATALLEKSRTVVDDNIKNYLFDGEYRAESITPEYRNGSDCEAYSGIPNDAMFNVRIAIEAFIVFSSLDGEFIQDTVQLKSVDELKHTAPFPSHPHIIEVCINGEPITAETHSLNTATLDKLMQNVNDHFENCAHGGGYIPYLEMKNDIYY